MEQEDLTRARNRLAAGRIRAMEKAPYLSTALLSLEPREIIGFGTFAVDQKWIIYYDPQKCLDWSVDEIAAVWLHEISHVIRNHADRFNATGDPTSQAEFFNIAADAAINSDLRDMGVSLPDADKRWYAEANPMYPKWRRNMTAEEMYSIAKKGNGKSQDEQKGKSSEKQDSENNDSQDESSQDTSEDKTQEDSSTESQESEESQDSQDSQEDESNEKSDGEKDSSESNDVDKDDSEEDSEEDSDSGPSESSDSEEKSEDGESSDSDSSGDEEGEDSEEVSEDDSEDSDSQDGEQDGDSPDDGSEGDSEDGSDGEEDSEGGSEGDSSESDDGSEGESTEESSGHSHDGNCGSGAHGIPQEYEVDDGSGFDPMEAEQMRRQVAQEINDYNERYGNVPGGMVRDAKEILDPQVDWTEELLSQVRKEIATVVGQSDYTYSRPSRRASQTPFILPSMRQAPPPEIVVILDTSGSMKIQEELAQALGEMEELIESAARYSTLGGIRIINCDAGANIPVIVSDLDDFEIVGGGGTDMRVGIKAASELDPPAGIIITMTDGFTPWPREIPEDNQDALYIALIIDSSKKKSGASQQRGWSTTGIPDWMTVIEVQT